MSISSIRAPTLTASSSEVLPTVVLFGRSEVFGIALDLGNTEVTGSLLDTMFGAEWIFNEVLRVGFAYNTFLMDVTAKRDLTRGDLDLDYQAILGYLEFTF